MLWKGACGVLEGCGILEKLLAEFWRSVAFSEGACSILEGRDKSTVFYMQLPVICSHSQI